MQKRQGYCTYCRVAYPNLEQHLFSAQHRSVTRQSRERLINNGSLMDRFLQDVLQHHPYNYQDVRLAQYETPARTVSPEVIRLDEFFPEDTEVEEISSQSSESVEDLRARPGASQNSAKQVSVRPSVIQKLEKGQQQSLEFNKIESGVRKINPVAIGQATNDGKSVIRPPVICNAPARCLPGSSHDRPVAASTSRLPSVVSTSRVPTAGSTSRGPPAATTSRGPPAATTSRVPPAATTSKVPTATTSKVPTATTSKVPTATTSKVPAATTSKVPAATTSKVPTATTSKVPTATTSKVPTAARSELVNKCNPNKVNKYLEQPDEVPRNRVPPCRPGTFSVSYENPKESSRKSVRVNLNNMLYQKDVKRQGETLSPVFKFHELRDTKSSVRVKSSSKPAVNSVGKPNKPDVPPARRTSEGAIPKRRGEFPSHLGCTQEEKRLLYNKPEFSKQKSSVSANGKFDRGCLQSVSVPAPTAAQELYPWEEGQEGPQDENCRSRASETSSDYDSFSHSPTDLSEVTSGKLNLSEETHATLQYKSNKACESEIGSDDERHDSLQEVANQSQVIVKEKGPQKAKRISLVDESYDSSGSEINFDCGDSAEPPDTDPQQPDVDVIFPGGVPVDLVDRSYGSASSKGSAASVASLESTVEEPPVDVPKKKLRKKKVPRKPRIWLVDKSYGSSYSESGSDSDGSPRSVADRPRATVKEGKWKGRPERLKIKKCKPSSAKARLACGGSLEAVADRPQRDVGGINLKKKKAGLVEMNCESRGPEMGFHADAQLVADESQVAIKEVNPQAVDIDLETKSVQSSISDLSFESRDCPYRSAHDELEGDVGGVNLAELNVDMEVKSSGCSSSELTFDSDSPLSVTERSQLDVERLKEDRFILEEESCESSSSDITFDSDIPTCSVVDQPQVAVYEEEPVLENESGESCVSEITFDSDIPLHSGNDQAEVAVKEVIIQEEEYVPLASKNANPSGSEISLDSYAPLHSVTNPPGVAIKKLNSQKEEPVLSKCKENEPADSELNSNYDIRHPTAGPSEDLVNDTNAQKEEHGCLELRVSGTRLDSEIPLLSVIHKPQVVVENIWLHKEKQAEFPGKSAGFSASEIKSNVPHCPVTEPQVSLKKKEKKKHIEKKTDKYGNSELILNSDDFPQSMPRKPQLAVWREDLVHPEDESTQRRSFEINVDVLGNPHSVPQPPHLILLKEKHFDLKDKNSKASDPKISFNSIDHLPSSPEHPKVVNKINLSKEETILKNNIDEPSCSKTVNTSDVPLMPVADQPEVAVKQVNQGKEGQIHSEKKSQNVCSELNLDSDFLVQAIIDRPHIAVEKAKEEGKHDPAGDSAGDSASAASVQPVADQPREMVKEATPEKDEDVDREEGKRDEAEGLESTPDSDARQPVTDQAKVIQQVKPCRKHLDLENEDVRPSDSKLNVDSNDAPQSLTDRIPEPDQEANLPGKGHVCLDDKGCKPHGSEIIYVSNIPPRSVIQQPHSSQEKDASLEIQSSDPRPTTSFDSSEPCQSVPGQLQKTVQEMNLQEGHIYLEDKSYALVEFEASYDSDVPVQFVVDPSHASATERNVQEEDPNAPEDESYEGCCSEMKHDSGLHLQSEADPPPAACKEAGLQNKELSGMEEKAREPSDSEMMYDSNISFQIIVNQSQSSDGEADPPEVVFVGVVASDSDYDHEVISDPNVPLQLVTGPPQFPVEEASCLNVQSVDAAKSYCDVCGSELRHEASSQPVMNQSKKTFKIINRKNDYIILGDSTCQSCGGEVDFNVDASDQSVTYLAQAPGQECFRSAEKKCRPHGPEGNFYFQGTSQKTYTEVNLWKDPKYTGLGDKSWESSGSAVDRATHPESVIHHTARRENPLKLKHADVAHSGGTSYSSQINVQGDPPIQADVAQPQEAVKKTRPRKRVTFDTREYHYFPSSSVPVIDFVRNLDEAPEVIEDDPSPPVLEPFFPVSPPVGGETWPQKMGGDNVKTNWLAEEFEKDHFHSYSHNNQTAKKVLLREETKPAGPDSHQKAAPVQILPASNDVAGGAADSDDISVPEKSRSHHPQAGELQQNCHSASQSQALKVSHATQTNLKNYPLKKRKITGQEEEPPKRKCLQSDKKGKTKAQPVTGEVPTCSTKALESGQPKSAACVISSADKKRKEGKSSSSLKTKQGSCDNQVQFMGKGKQNSNDPSPKQIAGNPPQNTGAPGCGTSQSADSRPSGSAGNSSAGGNNAPAQNPAPKAFITTARYKLRSRCGSSESCIFLESIDNVKTGEAPKDDDFQPTPSNREDAKIAPKSVTSKSFESKSKKIPKRKATTSVKPGFPQSIYKAVVLQQKTRATSAKQSIWIRTKANAIIRKYTLKYSVFLRHRYQTRTTFFAVNPKKKVPDGGRLKKGREPAKMLLNPSISPPRFKARLRAVAGPTLKCLVLRSSSTEGRNELEDKTYTYKKKTPILVKAYELRSSCFVPTGGRRTTRLSSKQK